VATTAPPTAAHPSPRAFEAGTNNPVSTRPWGIGPDRYAHLMRSLRFQHFKWDTYAVGANLILPESIVLSRRTHERIVAAVEGLHGALKRFEANVRRRPDLLSRLAISPELHGIIADEEEDTLQLTRCDFFPCEDGRWMISEFNEDVPGGFNEAVIPMLVGDPGPGLGWEGDLKGHFIRAFASYERVALLYATAFSEDLQHMLILERWLREAGHSTVLGSPAHLESRWRRPSILGSRIDAAFRFFPGEWMPKLPNLDVWRRLGPRLPMMNPLHRLIRQSKTMFSFWMEDGDLDPGDRELIARHCPVTLPFDSALLERLRDEKGAWVIKRAFGRMGDSVVIGSLVTEKEWDATLAEALRSPRDYCAQERFLATPLEFEVGPLFPAIGAFLINGRFAGYYSRAAPRPLITHEALHVATLVESA